MNTKFLRLLLIGIVVCIGTSFSVAQKRNITEKDLFDFVWIGDPQLSPDGSTVAFTKVWVNEKKDGYNTSIWSVSTASGEMHQLTSGTRDGSPRWSPDGRYLAFVRVTEKDGRPDAPQLFMLPMNGGDSFQFTTLARGAGQPVWSPDGKWIAFSNSANTDDLNKTAKKPGDDSHESDVRVITKAVYRSNGVGYLDPKHPGHIWVVQAPKTADDKGTPRQLTSGRYAEGGAIWANDGSRIYFTSSRIDEPYYVLPTTTIYSVAASGGEPVKLTTINMGAGGFSLSPDGKRMAFVASANEPVRSYAKPDLWVMDLAQDAKPRNITSGFDYDVGSGVGGDNAPPRAGGGRDVVWSSNGRELVTVYAKQGVANLGRFDISSGKETDVTTGDQAILGFDSSNDGSKFVYTISTPTQIGDLYWMDRFGAQPKRLTNINNGLFSKLNLTEPEMFWYTSFDGKKVQAWIQKPPNFDPNKKYPLILNIHGGPHSAYGYVFDHEFQWMAAKGYVVLYPNPRGSTSYGQDFGNIIQYKYPGDDYKDLMAGVDEVIKRGYIDTTKLGVTGGSGGGLLTDWTVTQTDRFAAAVAQRDISSWADWWYSDDFTLFQATWFKAPPFEDPEDYRSRSPITYIKNVKTPMMFILGDADYRTPPSGGGEQMFRALKYRKIPTVMVRFPGESHELSRSGQPWHRIERLEHIVGWFDHWLMGVPKPEYDAAQ
jgi:dipeptidyl aminopeptidase/acylaminoacyl peptidase